ncbi:ArnT family glycosyltransferase, partial [Candidatus Omnitrophota bacterium]
SFICYGLFITLSTEILSLFNQINYPIFLLIWILTAILTGFFALKGINKVKIKTLLTCSPISLSGKILILGVILICCATALIAYVSPPNNYDSMTYHMSRVANWIQHHNIKGYPTHVERQLWITPFTEFCILHFQILTNSDYFANFVQWIAMIGCLLGVSLIAKQLAVNRLGQICAAVFCATIPMGILQSTNTKTSFVLSLFLLCFIHLMLKLQTNKHWTIYALLGASLGLIGLTKSTGLIFCFPFLCWMTLLHIKHFSKKIIPSLILVVFIALAINSGHFTRNYQLGGHILSPVKESTVYSNDEINAALMLSNTIKNTSLHLGTPWKNINNNIDHAIRQFHKMIKININDERITFIKLNFTLPVLAYHEDHAGNPLHFLLILLSIFFFIVFRIRDKRKTSLFYLIATASAFILFCAILKWQPWHSRLHTPIFILFSPFIAGALRTKNNNKTIFIICLTLILCSAPWILKNTSRPITGKQKLFDVPRNQRYFFNRPDYLNPFHSITQQLNDIGCHDIALTTHGDVWEYPFWPLFKEKLKTFRIRRINVKNQTATLPTPATDDFAPCASIGFKKQNNIEYYENKLFVRTHYFPPLSLHIADTTNALRKQNCITHFIRRRKLDGIANALLKKMSNNSNPSKNDIVQYMNIRKSELAEAELVDTDLLNSL